MSRAMVVLLLIFVFSPRARALENPKSCAISVGLLDHLKPFSNLQLPNFEECQTSCRSTMARWESENYSTRCEWNGKTFTENKISLMDINWAICQVDSSPALRISRRACVRSCVDRLKRSPKGTLPESVHCEWDGQQISQAEIERMRGLFP